MVRPVNEKVSEFDLSTAPSAAMYVPVVTDVAAVATTVKMTRAILVGNIDAREHGIVANSAVVATANVAALNAAIVAANAASVALMGPVEVLLPAGKFWIAGTVSVKSNVTLRGAGMSKTVLYMSAANYPNTTWNSRNATSMAIDASGIFVGPYTPARNIKICDFTIESEVSDGRVLYGIRSTNVVNLEISNVEIFGLPVGNAMEVNSLLGSSSIHDCYIHDCGTAVTTYLTQPQMTCIEVDNNKTNGIQSRGLNIHDNAMIDVMLSGAALAAYGGQSDAINLPDSISTRVHDNYARNVGEGIDCFAFDCNIHGNILVDCYHAGIKLIHGASRNNVGHNTILRPGRSGVSLSGVSAATVDNYIHDNIIHDVNISHVWDAVSNAALHTISGGGTEANNNTFRNNKVTGGTNMDYVVRNEAGTGNRFYDTEAESWLVLYSSVSGGSATISNAKKTLVRVSVGSGQATTSGNEVTVAYDTETSDTQNEFNGATSVYTATSHRRIRVYAQVRSSSNFTGAVKIRLNGAQRASFDPAIAMGTIAVSDSFSVVPGDTVDVRFVQITGAITLTANSETTYLTIEEVAG